MSASARALALVVAGAAAAALVGAGVALALGGDDDSGSDATVRAAPTRGAARTPEAIYERAAPGVVVITATQTQTIPGTASSQPTSERVGVLGSGFVIDRDGDILTNDHVVQDGMSIRVGFSSGRSYPASIVGTDVSSDIAVVRVQAPAAALHPLAFGDSDAVRVGDPVYAIGNPLGLDRTMTSGIASALGRDIQAPNGRTIPGAIQTDASINEGNSGGPLLDRSGRVIGVNDQIASNEDGGGSIGLGFAISSRAARASAARLIQTARPSRAS
jgi:S1-C subfamily serine protease